MSVSRVAETGTHPRALKIGVYRDLDETQLLSMWGACGNEGEAVYRRLQRRQGGLARFESNDLPA